MEKRLLAGQKETTEKLAEGQQELARAFRRQMTAVEDFLEEQQERQDAAEAAEKLLQAEKERELALCRALALCTEQLDQVEQALTGQAKKAGQDSATLPEQAARAWAGQFGLMRQKRRQLCGLAGVQELGNVGEPFDYRLHDVLDTVSAQEKELEGRIARVYRTGLMFDGKVLEKAQVCAYRGEKDERQDNRD
ncbi:MAG: nucleotide exchange factor GrpE [Eubacteriales bacterium]|nr:nucleotide exchange factor GrpE [Eubacteriales bacterium]